MVGRLQRDSQIVEAAHPVPDEAGRRAAEQILARVQGLGEDDLVIALISGGGSSLLSLPAPGLTLEDKQICQPGAPAVGCPDRCDELRAQASLGDQGRQARGGNLSGPARYPADLGRAG